MPPTPRHTLIVEHLDPELEAWQALEYRTIAAECQASSTAFLLSGLASAAQTQQQLDLPSSNLTETSVEARYSTPEQKARVCLLDPKAEKDLAPEDGEAFDVFLFGGILGDDPPRGNTSPSPPPSSQTQCSRSRPQTAQRTSAATASPLAAWARTK